MWALVPKDTVCVESVAYAMEFRLVKRMIRGTRGCKALALFSNFKWARSPAFRHDAGASFMACNNAPRAAFMTLDIVC